jgi:hypothetical protein
VDASQHLWPLLVIKDYPFALNNWYNATPETNNKALRNWDEALFYQKTEADFAKDDRRKQKRKIDTENDIGPRLVLRGSQQSRRNISNRIRTFA